MKQQLTACLAAIALAAGISSCKKDTVTTTDAPVPETPQKILSRGFCSFIVGTVTVTGNITANRTFHNDTLYILDGRVQVTNGATLTIEPDTRIEATNILGAPSSALVITPGAKIDAQGTETCPIVFTTNLPSPAPRVWAGVQIQGNPNNVNDNSGIMSYVHIEYAGQQVTIADVGSLHLINVGAGTTLSHIESYYSGTDAFYFHGGTVNASYLLAISPMDDVFDFTDGYRGTISNCLSILDPNAPYRSADPCGIESDNDLTGSSAIPRTAPVLNHLTIIGVQNAATATNHNLYRALRFRRNSSFKITNSIFMGYPTGASFESAGTLADIGNLTYNLVHGFTNVITSPPSLPSTNIPHPGYPANCNTYVQLVSPFDLTDFSPVSSSAAAYSGLGGTYLGAFDPNATPWTYVWANLTFL